MRFISIFLFLLVSLQATVIAGDGGISSEAIGRIKQSMVYDDHTTAMFNAITNNDINKLALNRELLREHNENFSHKIKAKGITDQKSSGRCWLYAGLNILRPAVIEKYKLDGFEFSHAYLQFWDKLEKANTFLELIIEMRDRDLMDREMVILLDDPYGDGGWWKSAVDLIEKYGTIPKEIMPETNSSGKTSMMNKLISRKLRADAVKIRKMYAEGKTLEELRAEKELMLSGVYKMMALNLGEPPATFEWRFEDIDSVMSDTKTYTPKSFYKEFVGVDLNDYVNIFNDPTKDYDEYYTIRMSKNMYDRDDIAFANAEIGTLKELAMKAVLDDKPVWFACDVGKDQNSKNGIMAMDIYDYGPIYNIDMGMSKAERSFYRESSANHAMVLIGVDVVDDKPVKWRVENSWGTVTGKDGYWTLYDTWFDNHVYNVIILKKYVPDDILEIIKRDPTVIPPWDPMYNMLKK